MSDVWWKSYLCLGPEMWTRWSLHGPVCVGETIQHALYTGKTTVTVSIYYGYTSIYIIFIERCMIIYEVKGLFIHLFVANGATYFFYTSIYTIFLVKYVTIYEGL